MARACTVAMTVAVVVDVVVDVIVIAVAVAIAIATTTTAHPAITATTVHPTTTTTTANAILMLLLHRLHCHTLPRSIGKDGSAESHGNASA